MKPNNRNHFEDIPSLFEDLHGLNWFPLFLFCILQIHVRGKERWEHDYGHRDLNLRIPNIRNQRR